MDCYSPKLHNSWHLRKNVANLWRNGGMIWWRRSLPSPYHFSISIEHPQNDGSSMCDDSTVSCVPPVPVIQVKFISSLIIFSYILCLLFHSCPVSVSGVVTPIIVYLHACVITCSILCNACMQLSPPPSCFFMFILPLISSCYPHTLSWTIF